MPRREPKGGAGACLPKGGGPAGWHGINGRAPASPVGLALPTLAGTASTGLAGWAFAACPQRFGAGAATYRLRKGAPASGAEADADEAVEAEADANLTTARLAEAGLAEACLLLAEGAMANSSVQGGICTSAYNCEEHEKLLMRRM